MSNKLGPAIVLNADLLFGIEKKWLGLRKKPTFLLSHRGLLEWWFTQSDLSIYIVCSGEYLPHKKEIEDLLYTFMVPHSRVFDIETAGQLAYLVEAEHIIGYFYLEETLVDVRTSVQKHYQVPHLAEIGYLLAGGERK